MFKIDENHFMPCNDPTGHFPSEKPRYTMTEEVEHTAREMKNTIDMLLKFEKRLEAKFEDMLKHLTSDNVLFKNTFAEAYNSFLMEVKNEVNVFEGNVDSTITLFQKTLESDYATLSEDCKKQITEYYNDFIADLNEFRDAIESRLAQYNDTYTDAFNSYTAEMGTKLSTMETALNQSYAKFVNQVNNSITEFKIEWTKTIDARLDGQDSVITDAVAYMKTNFNASVENLLFEMKENGTLIGVIESEIFVTPEMFGASGDGTTNDTNAFIQAIATGKPVVGNPAHTYKISSVEAHNTKISGCKFVSNGNTDNGLILKSGTTIEKCAFAGFKNALMNSEANIVASTIRDCTIEYCLNGIYLNMPTGYSVNKLVVENNYFVKHGTGADNMSAEPSSENGFGLFLGGNICGAHIFNNVFEYNTFAGIVVKNDNTNYRLGVFIHDNYFEGNKHSAIYLGISNRTAHQISVNNNFYSVLDTNVFVTNQIYVDNAVSSVYTIADDNAVFCCSKFTDVKTHKPSLTSNNCDSIYVQLSPVKFGIEYIRFTYKATLTSDVAFKDVSGNELFKITNGTHSETIPYDSSFVLGRTLNSGETIEILHFGE